MWTVSLSLWGNLIKDILSWINDIQGEAGLHINSEAPKRQKLDYWTLFLSGCVGVCLCMCVRACRACVFQLPSV